ncbi:MAG: DnaJ C-terminal domain-containing protein, partial [Thermodesulfobacteriota bacterium]|nr:DnaJ C-terminal domain-containing protein [Thermodesulfobacteriota bacterium]
RLRHYTDRKATPRLQSISPQSSPEELDLDGEIIITPKEAVRGTRKLIAVPQGLKKRNIWVTIPPGVREGTRLRLRGLGRVDRKGNRGDLFLEVRFLH